MALEAAGPSRGHGHPRNDSFTFLGAAKSTANATSRTNATQDTNAFMSQMGGGWNNASSARSMSAFSSAQSSAYSNTHNPSAAAAALRAGAQRGGSASQPPNSFNPPTAPASMRGGDTGRGTTFQTANSVQWRPNPTGSSMQAAERIRRQHGGDRLVQTGLPNGWYR